MNFYERLLYRLATDFDRSVYDRLTAEPAKWSSERGYHLDHDDGRIRIWIANKAYALHIEVGRGLRHESVYPGFAGSHLIWRAVKRLKVPSVKEFERARAMNALRSTEAA